MARGGIQNRRAFERDLDKFVDGRNFAEDFVRRFGREIIREVIAQAHQGNGPNGVRYPAYSDKYLKVKKGAQGGTLNNWLRGIKGGVRMLDEKRFEWRIVTAARIELVWTAANSDMGKYAVAHNEGEGDMPKREWMHFEAPQTVVVLDLTLNRLVADRAAIFNAKWA